MLMVMRIDVGSDSRPVLVRLAVLRDVDLEDSSKADLQLDGPILVEMVVPYVFYIETSVHQLCHRMTGGRTVIRQRANHADYQATTTNGL